MNRAVFLFTFYRFTNPWSLISLILFTIGIPIFLVYGIVSLSARSYNALDPELNRLISVFMDFLAAPFLTMLVGYLFIRSSVGNAKSLNDGEYMALLFSRPLTRSSYVIAKWLAGSMAVFLIVSCQLLCFSFGLAITKSACQCPIEITDIANILFNSLGITALIVMIQSFPPRVGKALFLTILYCSFLIPLVVSSSFSRGGSTSDLELQNFICTISVIVRSFLYPSIDMNYYLDSVSFNCLPVFAFLSNIALYLLVSVWIINRREFFYANE